MCFIFFFEKATTGREQVEEPKHSHLHLQRPPLDLRDALGDDERDAVAGAAGHLREFPPEELQTAPQLLVAALDGQRLQAAFVTSQETLRTHRDRLRNAVFV